MLEGFFIETIICGDLHVRSQDFQKNSKTQGLPGAIKIKISLITNQN